MCIYRRVANHKTPPTTKTYTHTHTSLYINVNRSRGCQFYPLLQPLQLHSCNPLKPAEILSSACVCSQRASNQTKNVHGKSPEANGSMAQMAELVCLSISISQVSAKKKNGAKNERGILSERGSWHFVVLRLLLLTGEKTSPNPKRGF